MSRAASWIGLALVTVLLIKFSPNARVTVTGGEDVQSQSISDDGLHSWTYDRWAMRSTVSVALVTISMLIVAGSAVLVNSRAPGLSPTVAILVVGVVLQLIVLWFWLRPARKSIGIGFAAVTACIVGAVLTLGVPVPRGAPGQSTGGEVWAVGFFALMVGAALVAVASFVRIGMREPSA